MINQVAMRYARALYELAVAGNKTDLVLSELRVLSAAIQSEPELQDFLSSPVVAPAKKIAALEASLKGKVSEEILGTLRLMADKSRLELFVELMHSFELIYDEANGVIRGQVKSAAVISSEERKKIEETVKQVVKKNVIMTYSEDETLLGGMVARVAGWTFDDSLKTHLNKLKEELNRRAN